MNLGQRNCAQHDNKTLGQCTHQISIVILGDHDLYSLSYTLQLQPVPLSRQTFLHNWIFYFMPSFDHINLCMCASVDA